MLTAATIALAAWALARLLATAPAGGVVRRCATIGRGRSAIRAGGGGGAGLPEAVDAVAAAVRSGRSVHDGVAVAAEEAPSRLAAELGRIGEDTARGLPIATALDRWAAASTEPGAGLVASAVGLTAATGGDVAAALGGAADTLRERRALTREIRALSSQARLSAAVVAVAPLGFAGLASVADGDTARFLLATPAGGACLAVGLGLDLLGWRWMGRIAASVGGEPGRGRA